VVVVGAVLLEVSTTVDSVVTELGSYPTPSTTTALAPAYPGFADAAGGLRSPLLPPITPRPKSNPRITPAKPKSPSKANKGLGHLFLVTGYWYVVVATGR
jgi:hypothetical protein